MLEKNYEKETTTTTKARPAPATIEWCTGADDWGDEGAVAMNLTEENGNVISTARISDEEDESTSMGSDPLIPAMNNLGIDDRNANAAPPNGACAMAAERVSLNPTPSAEIEGEEAEVIMLDSPPIPRKDIQALLRPSNAHKEVAKDVQMQSFYIALDQERAAYEDQTISEHIKSLLMDYEGRRECSPEESPGAAGGFDDQEGYERGVPLHGDMQFHHFVQRIQENPGQIVRYSRDAGPLLIAPLREMVQRCQNCGSELLCEMQILPTVISKLKLDTGEPATFDFGTVLVFTCAKSCWDTPDKMRFETVIVQQEEDSVKPGKN